MDFVLSKIAFRNLKQHKSKTLIIGLLVAVSIAILIIGSSILTTINNGIEKNYVEKYTGSIFVAPDKNSSPSLIFPSVSEGSTSVIKNFDELQNKITDIKGIKDTTGQINSAGLIKFGENGEGFGIFLGVDSLDYQKMFSSGINITQGTFLNDGEEGIVLSQYVLDMINATSKVKAQIGDKLIISTINDSTGTKIREVTIRGVHQFDDSSIDVSLICFLDQENSRALNGILLNTEQSLNLNDNEKENLGTFDEDSLFSTSSDDLFADNNDLFDQESLNDTISSEEDFLNILGDTSERATLNALDNDAWSYMLIKLDNTNNTDQMINNLNDFFTENDLELTAYKWTDGAGMSAQLADVAGTIFYAILAIIAVVVVIVIMNTLVVSVSERTAEIGTMRAIGAKKSFIRNMIGMETLFITIVFGIIGCLIGVGVLGILGQIGLKANGMFMKILLGGDVFIPIISFSSIIWSLIIISVISVLASLYPVALALRISPREAMSAH